MDNSAGREALTHIHHLAEDIGPRPPTSEGERRGADYVAEVLRSLGAEVSVEEFRAPRSFSYAFGLIYLMGCVAASLGVVLPPAGVAVGAVAVILFLLEVDTRGSVWRLFSWRPSRNVIGRFNAKAGGGRPRVVLMAHHDTSRSALLFDPGRVAGFRRAFLLMWLCFLLTPLASSASQLGQALENPVMIGLRYLNLLAAVYLGGSLLVLIHREIWGVDVAGANDNASGVGVALEVAQTLAGWNAEAWVVATGAEEAGCVGALNLVERYGENLQETVFINLDNVGAGQGRYARAEGMLSRFSADPELLSVAEEVARDRPDLGFSGVVNALMSTDAVVLLARGYRALSLRAEDHRGLLPNWHWPTDTYENIDPDTVSSMVEFSTGLLERLTQENPEGQPGA